MTNIICNECETVAHCMNNGCVPKQPAYRAVKTYHEGKPVYVAEQPASTLEELYALSKEVSAEEAMKLALEALEELNQTNSYWWQDVDENLVVQLNNSETALREALAEPTSADYAMGYAEGFNDACKPAPATELREQEPVAWGVDWGKAGDIPCVSIIKRLPGGGIEVVAVEYAPYSYTSPPPQQEPVELCQYGQEPASCTSNPMDCQCAIDAALAQPEQPIIKSYLEKDNLLQPLVVPDALTAQDPETLEYILGWNDCRQLMMEMLRKEIK